MKLRHDVAPEDIRPKRPVVKTVVTVTIAAAATVAAAGSGMAVTAKMLHDCCIW